MTRIPSRPEGVAETCQCPGIPSHAVSWPTPTGVLRWRFDPRPPSGIALRCSMLQTALECVPPFAQHPYEDFVRPAAHDTDERVPAPEREPQGRGKKNPREHLVGPGIQPPLPVPEQHGILAEWTEVENGPEIVRRRTS